MTFAAIDANGWVMIISAIGVIAMQALTMILSYLRDSAKSRLDKKRERAKLKRDNMVAGKVDVIAQDVRKVELATNSMKDALVEASGKAGELKGAADERGRATSLRESKEGEGAK